MFISWFISHVFLVVFTFTFTTTAKPLPYEEDFHGRGGWAFGEEAVAEGQKGVAMRSLNDHEAAVWKSPGQQLKFVANRQANGGGSATDGGAFQPIPNPPPPPPQVQPPPPPPPPAPSPSGGGSDGHLSAFTTWLLIVLISATVIQLCSTFDCAFPYLQSPPKEAKGNTLLPVNGSAAPPSTATTPNSTSTATEKSLKGGEGGGGGGGKEGGGGGGGTVLAITSVSAPSGGKGGKEPALPTSKLPPPPPPPPVPVPAKAPVPAQTPKMAK